MTSTESRELALTERFRTDAARSLEDARRDVGRYQSRLRTIGADTADAARAAGALVVAVDAIHSHPHVGVVVDGRQIKEVS